MNTVQEVHVNSPKVDKLKTKYKHVFEGIGCMPGKQSLRVNPDVSPVVHAPRRVPVALRERVNVELKRMETEGIITKVTDPGRGWVSSMCTVVKPSGKVRICLDPAYLNKALEREYYTIPCKLWMLFAIDWRARKCFQHWMQIADTG